MTTPKVLFLFKTSTLAKQLAEKDAIIDILLNQKEIIIHTYQQGF